MSAPLQLVSRAEFARMRNVSRKTVTKWVESGRIQIVIDAHGREMIDPAAATVALMNSSQRERELEAILSPLADTDDEELGLAKAAAGPSLTQLKARTEDERAQLLRLERLGREGLVVPRDQVEREQEAAARIVRKAIESIPSHAEDLAAAAASGGMLAVRKELKRLVARLEETMAKALVEAAELAENDTGDEFDEAAA